MSFSTIYIIDMLVLSLSGLCLALAWIVVMCLTLYNVNKKFRQVYLKMDEHESNVPKGSNHIEANTLNDALVSVSGLARNKHGYCVYH
jgi:1,4-dihydroxy-2-naphthoate octaprenyltransferase